MWPAPKPKFKPAVWRYAAARAALDQAGEFVPVEQAERRNLIMVNPIEGNLYATHPQSGGRLSMREGRRDARARTGTRRRRCGWCWRRSPAPSRW